MSGITRVSFECAKCGRFHKIRITVEDPNLMGDTAEEQTRYGYQDFECPCGNNIEFDISNDVDSVIVDAPFGGAKNIRTERPVYECFCDEDEYLEYCKALYDNDKINTFMQNFLGPIRADFLKYVKKCKANKVDLCAVQLDFRPNSSNFIDYKKPEVQQYYYLRYFYAYFLEYHYIYKKIHLNDYKVLSIGCGSCLDLMSLYFVQWEKLDHISYCGVDPADWMYKQFLQKAKNFQYFQGDLKTYLAKNSIDDFNVIIFPKSIEHLNNDICTLLSVIKRTSFKEDCLYLILNGMKDIRSDVKTFDLVKDAISQKGYDVTETYEKANSFIQERFEELPEQILFPFNKYWLKNLSSECHKKPICAKKSDCPIDMYPILKTLSFNYKIYKLEKI